MTSRTSELRDFDPLPFLPTLHAELRELNALRTFAKAPAEGLVECDVTQEQLPLDLEAVVVLDVVRNLLPVLHEVDRLRHIRIPDRLGRLSCSLHHHLAQASNRAAFVAVDLDGEQ